MITFEDLVLAQIDLYVFCSADELHKALKCDTRKLAFTIKKLKWAGKIDVLVLNRDGGKIMFFRVNDD